MSLYETDFYAWTQRQAEALKQHQWELLDLPNLLEEIAALGRRERQELRNRLGILLGHLLLWQYQPELRGNSWLATVRAQRREILTLLQENPSLKPYLQEALALAYQSGLDLAVRETGFSYTKFPESCPYTWEQTLDAEFFPN
ncbi:DUF29 domain-containing protein [Planktothricoides raciborskii]|uniref:DUF29 domain-containing protein n=2 Tax=Planktothricoides raciborskii TaxID=132608 RepID=A0AAU8J6U9_9CYAN|nr:DUF29 domain-containing protein [Planktothricoides raciborskii]MBD2544994.1 DUF29 domain-containing protein [Planktothricoides raciborskii FACHB-1370]MBD2584702.1 DUF29 domain-containing protein [Planktothricoides raciborskii FACHB-1261]